MSIRNKDGSLFKLNNSTPPVIHKENPPEIPKIENKLIAFCLISKDNKWENKTAFDIKILEKDLVFCFFWAKLNIPKNSILYLYNGTKQFVGEWWKVVETQPYQEGIMIKCMPSEETPSF